MQVLGQTADQEWTLGRGQMHFVWFLNYYFISWHAAQMRQNPVFLLTDGRTYVQHVPHWAGLYKMQFLIYLVRKKIVKGSDTDMTTKNITQLLHTGILYKIKKVIPYIEITFVRLWANIRAYIAGNTFFNLLWGLSRRGKYNFQAY
jgi:hypothetical protein